VPKLNLILTLICRNYLASQDPSFTHLPVVFGEMDPQCQIPEVQARVSRFQLVLNLIAGSLSAVASPKLGALSDSYGRTRIIALSVFGIFLGEILTVVVASRPESFHVNWLLLGSVLDGVFGSVTTTLALSQSYNADCSPPERRNLAFGYFHGVLFTGIAIGPLAAGYLIKRTQSVLPVFYTVVGCHLFFLLCALFIIPESVSEERKRHGRAKREIVKASSEDLPWISLKHLNPLNLLKPLSILFPLASRSEGRLGSENEDTLRLVQRNLFILSAIDASMFGVQMGSLSILILYAEYMFGWENFESGVFVSVTASMRVLVLVVILPIATRLVRGPQSANRQGNTGADKLDIGIIKVSILFDMLGYIGYTLARTGPLLMLSGAVAACSGMSSPTLQSALTKHIPSDRTGQLLGAIGLLHALTRVLSPTLFNLIYSVTVGTFPQTVFVCLTALILVALFASFFLKAHGKFPFRVHVTPKTSACRLMLIQKQQYI
jgi:MFS family permease